MTEQDYTEIKDERIRGKICELMSEMLDNPDDCGIYPTSRFMWKMETFILGELQRKIRDTHFINHIQAHLKDGEVVICKICGKTADEICSER